ncbi:MAG: hypothetical protein PHS37_02225 [Candidatus Omnitrophica bacterium]|nr:hypothetical protein [Candidatus Omnitrophota bacterium]
MKTEKLLTVFLAVIMVCAAAYGQKPLTFDFEKNTDGWDIPDWAMDQKDCVGRVVTATQDVSNTGKGALKIETDYPGNQWASVIVEYEKDLDLRGYKAISADVYIPKECKTELMQARIVVTAGSDYFWIEAKTPVRLVPGKWATVTAPLNVSENGELNYWRCKDLSTCILAHLDQVKKVAIRIEYNASPKNAGAPYKGPVYVDNIKIE